MASSRGRTLPWSLFPIQPHRGRDPARPGHGRSRQVGRTLPPSRLRPRRPPGPAAAGASVPTITGGAATPKRRTAGRDMRLDAWGWAQDSRAEDGSLPSGRAIGSQYGRHERWGRMVKRSGRRAEYVNRTATSSRPQADSRHRGLSERSPRGRTHAVTDGARHRPWCQSGGRSPTRSRGRPASRSRPNRKIPRALSVAGGSAGVAGWIWPGCYAAAVRVTWNPRASSCRTWLRALRSVSMRLA
jgi:hypothetical protein